jgi:phosphopantetheine--protein transferase-like protein
LSTWTCEATGQLLGCGVDAEKIERFAHGVIGGHDPWPLVFTQREIEHCRSLDDPALGLCAAFCAKEALIKALGVPIDYRHCELLFQSEQEAPRIRLDPALKEEHRTRVAMARVLLSSDRQECIVALCLERGS